MLLCCAAATAVRTSRGLASGSASFVSALRFANSLASTVRAARALFSSAFFSARRASYSSRDISLTSSTAAAASSLAAPSGASSTSAAGLSASSAAGTSSAGVASALRGRAGSEAHAACVVTAS
jgi:hypothetical protein